MDKEVDKLYKILMSSDVVLSICNNLDYLLELIPELNNMIGFEHKHPHHNLDVWNHTLKALSYSRYDFDIRLSLLLHDIGKPFSYQEEDNIRHFKGHPEVSYIMSKKILKRLNFKDNYIDKICFYIKNHDNPISDELLKNKYYDLFKLLEIQECDTYAHNPDFNKNRNNYLQKIKNKL